MPRRYLIVADGILLPIGHDQSGHLGSASQAAGATKEFSKSENHFTSKQRMALIDININFPQLIKKICTS
jgi:hypothetical protein